MLRTTSSFEASSSANTPTPTTRLGLLQAPPVTATLVTKTWEWVPIKLLTFDRKIIIELTFELNYHIISRKLTKTCERDKNMRDCCFGRFSFSFFLILLALGVVVRGKTVDQPTPTGRCAPYSLILYSVFYYKKRSLIINSHIRFSVFWPFSAVHVHRALARFDVVIWVLCALACMTSPDRSSKL